MAKFFIDRPIFAIVLSIFITIAGLVSITQLPIAQYPQITAPVVNVSASYVGANAEVVEQAVGQAIEQQVNGVENMVDMRSTSDDNGQYSLNVKFELGVNPDMATVQVQNRVAQATAKIPAAVQSSGITVQKQSPDTVMYLSLWSPKNTYDSLFLKNYANIYLVDDLKRVKGVGSVGEYGPEFGMRVWLQPDKMARLGITADDVGDAIKEQNVQAPAGTIGQLPSPKGQEFQYSARVQGQLQEESQFANIIVRAKPDGSFVRVSDVARVELAAKSYQYTSDLNLRDSVTLAIQLTPDANALDTVTEVKKVLETNSKRFPTDLEYHIVSDNTRFIDESMIEVVKTFVEALLLVLLIVFIFLQSWRATLIPMLAVPVSLIGTFGAFILLGFNINTLTMFAMVLAIGLVVDDAIVVVESVEHHMRYNGMTPKDAAYRAMEEVSGPVVAIAFVLASVFIPVAFFGGTAGVLYKQFALTIAVSMGLSALVALTLTPALCSLILKPHDPNAHEGFLGRFFDAFNDKFDAMTGRYGKTVRKFIRYSKLCLAGLLVIVVLALTFFKMLPTTFVPNEDQGYFMATINLPEAASMNRTRQVGYDVAEIVKGIPGVKDTLVIAGYDILAGALKPNAALLVVALDTWSERPDKARYVDSIIRQVYMKTARIPEATVMAFNAPALPGGGSTGAMTFMLQDRGGGNVEEMADVSKKFLGEARKRPELTGVYSTFRSDTPAFRYEVDREKAEKLGVKVDDVFSTLQAFLGGLQVNDFTRFGRTWKVVMQAEPQYRSDANDIRYFFVRSNTNAMVPLATLVKPVPISGPTAIKRFNGNRAIQIGASPAAGYSSGQAMTALEEVAKATLPNTYSYEWADQSRDEKLSGGRAVYVFGAAILFAFLCLAALYESWSVPFAVLLSVPTAIFGSGLFQWARSLENSIYMQIGLVMLIGLAAKNAILIVEFAKVRVDKGVDPVEAAIEAAKLRLRPILMTSLAFILGCVPLMIATGAGAGARNAMGTAVVGGMLAATLLGVFLIPVLYVVVVKLTRKLTWRK